MESGWNQEKKFKWTYDADYDEGQLEELLLQGHIRIPRENSQRGLQQNEKTRSPVTGTKMKQQQSKSATLH